MGSFVQSNFTGLQDKKNCTFIRFNIQRPKNIYNHTKSKETVKQSANILISPVNVPMHPKKYKTVWKNVPA
ncbi:hypothetical protein ACLIBG_10100 [Virgibacillus sp. W0181]|uniref:hypothetical protein n=1 Tax=Virgibacillus sp. W0181 TaxID=3391581 RepID=UPI003F47F43A